MGRPMIWADNSKKNGQKMYNLKNKKIERDKFQCLELN